MSTRSMMKLGSRRRPSLNHSLSALYQRRGARGVTTLAVLAALASSSVNSLLAAVFILHYLHASTHETVKIAGLVLVAQAAGVGLASLSRRELISSIRSWTPASHRPETERVLGELISLPRRVVPRAGVIIMALELPVLLLGRADLHLAWWVGVPAAVTVAGVIAANCVFVVLGVELILRPLRIDLSSRVGDDVGSNRIGLPLRTLMLVPIPGATLYAGMLVGSYATTASTPGARLTIALLVSLSTAAVAVALFALGNRSALEPIDRLIEATRRVRAGDLTSPVPIMTSDELGVLTHSFNEMVAGLRDREALREEVRTSRARIVAAADASRRRLEQDLHDGAQQQLVLIGLKLGALERDPTQTELLPELRADVERALGDLRDLAHGIYPPVLENEGLPGALQAAADRAGLPATLSCDTNERHDPEVEAAVYFCCLEALQNAAKHAGEAARAEVRLTQQNGKLKFKVSDDGVGFVPSRNGTGHGLQNMADRVGALGGELRIDSAPGHGTRIDGEIPLRAH